MAAKARHFGSVCARYLGSFTKKRSYAVGQIVSFTLDLQALCVVREPHFVIKRILGIVNNDLLTVFNKIRLLLDTQFTELNTKMELEKSTLAHRYSLDFMKSLSHFRLQGRILMQSIKRRLYEADDDQATVVMARLDEASQRSLQPLSNPELATKRGRPAGSTKRKAIQREKSLFEHATGRKCLRCGQAGHNSRTMQCANI
ncbi:hypothetical protein BASA84_001276 [Batrachochytrium salamandrivorans]|nr:hypothetical protein BASA84_001276 [Batrachochytrium salamandrivorans]